MLIVIGFQICENQKIIIFEIIFAQTPGRKGISKTISVLQIRHKHVVTAGTDHFQRMSYDGLRVELHLDSLQAMALKSQHAFFKRSVKSIIFH